MSSMAATRPTTDVAGKKAMSARRAGDGEKTDGLFRLSRYDVSSRQAIALYCFSCCVVRYGDPTAVRCVLRYLNGDDIESFQR